MAMIQCISMMLTFLIHLVVADPPNQCSSNNAYPQISPILISNTTQSCSYNEIMEIQFNNQLITVQTQVVNGVYQVRNFPLTGYTLYAEDANKGRAHYTISHIKIVTPIQHNFVDIMYTSSGSLLTNTLEMQIYFTLINGDQSNLQTPQAAISMLFTDSTPAYYIPKGDVYLTPFFSYGEPSQPAGVGSIDVNMGTIFSDIVNYYHQWYVYQGTTITENGCNQVVNWYVNTEVFIVKRSLITRYQSYVAQQEGSSVQAAAGQSSINMGLTNQQYTYTNIPQVNFTSARNSTYNFTNTGINTNILQICYSGLEETVLRQNYAVWLWVLGIFAWWIVEVITENDTTECFMDRFENNRWTQLPLYSVYWVNNDIFFTKLSRFVLILVCFSWEVLMLSIMYAQFYLYNVYTLQSGYIIWYAIVALMLGWPINYFFGSQLYHIRETWKERTQLQIEWKKIIDKTSLDAQELIKGIESESNRLYTSWFFFYFGLFFLLIMNFGVSIWQNTFLTRTVQNYWVASIFLMVFIDMAILDVIVAFIPGPRLTKYRGFYYDFELGKSYKRFEEA